MDTVDCGSTCTPTEIPESTCNDNIDNDCDGLIDTLDTVDCATCTATEIPESTCDDSIDNDCDGDTDTADSDCASTCTITEATETTCNDSIDNDCDGDTDSLDSDCQSSCATESPETSCTDGCDNDNDGLIDCADTNDCSPNASCTNVEVNCTDSFDNDGDGDEDCADTDCSTSTDCLGLPETCDNLIDDNNDGLIDCLDPGCFADPVCNTSCTATPGQESGETDCGDSIDNDCDGDTDTADSDCGGSGGTCTASGSLTGTNFDGSTVTFDTCGWVDLQYDGTGTFITNAIWTCFDMSQSSSTLTGCDFIEALMASPATETFTDGWYFEKVSMDNTTGLATGTYSMTGGAEAIAIKIASSAVDTDYFLSGGYDVTDYDSGAQSITVSNLTLSSGTASLSGTATMCNCPNLDPQILQGLAVVPN